MRHRIIEFNLKFNFNSAQFHMGCGIKFNEFQFTMTIRCKIFFNMFRFTFVLAHIFYASCSDEIKFLIVQFYFTMFLWISPSHFAHHHPNHLCFEDEIKIQEAWGYFGKKFMALNSKIECIAMKSFCDFARLVYHGKVVGIFHFACHVRSLSQ